jgi:hypothetical protein
MKVKCIDVAPFRKHQTFLADVGTISTNGGNRNCIHQLAWVIDNALSEDFLGVVNDFRQSLPLDAKRPTVKRRFFSSAKQCPVILVELQNAIVAALSLSSQSRCCEASAHRRQHQQSFRSTGNDEFSINHNHNQLQVHVLSYMRFLEYDDVGGNLDVHTDGNKICEDTGKQSTHTMLLYLSNCEMGGETKLLDKESNAIQTDQKTKYVVIEAVKPVVGRILLFPHATLHEGAPTVDVPKLCLRAEVALYE